MSFDHKCQKNSVYQPPQKTKIQLQRQSSLVMDEKSFPTLWNEPKKKIETENEDDESLDKNKNQMIYKDKLTIINQRDEDNKKEEDDLPDGWIRLKLDRKQKTTLKTVKKEAHHNKEEKIDFDTEYLINFFKKRRENYISVYGEDNYKKVFGTLNYYGYEYNSDNEIFVKEDES